MRIVAPLPAYPPAAKIGAFLATHRFLADMAARGHEVFVLRYPLYVQERDTYVHDGVTVHTWEDGDPKSGDLVDSADVIVSHCGDKRRGQTIALLAMKPSVVLVHGSPVPADLSADLVVFNSQWIVPAGFAGPHVVCHPVTPPDEYRTTPGDRVTLVNLHNTKGGELFDRLTRGMPGHLFLGVKGYSRAQICPNRPNVDVIESTLNMRDDVYARTRVLLMPSVAESWGMVGVEAMASGIPVIAHPTEGLRESLGSAGIFVDRADSQGWVDAIAALDDPDVYATASARALDRSAELDPQASLDTFADALEAL